MVIDIEQEGKTIDAAFTIVFKGVGRPFTKQLEEKVRHEVGECDADIFSVLSPYYRMMHITRIFVAEAVPEWELDEDESCDIFNTFVDVHLHFTEEMRRLGEMNNDRMRLMMTPYSELIADALGMHYQTKWSLATRAYGTMVYFGEKKHYALNQGDSLWLVNDGCEVE